MHNPFELGTDGPSVILVGIDGSDTSMRAGAYAAGLARRQHARLIGLYVSPISGFAGIIPGGAALLRQASEELAADLRNQVTQAAQDRGLALTFMEARGDPYIELIRVATEVRADAVVVGASMKAGHRFAGSLAVRLVRAGRWPVTVVP